MSECVMTSAYMYPVIPIHSVGVPLPNMQMKVSYQWEIKNIGLCRFFISGYDDSGNDNDLGLSLVYNYFKIIGNTFELFFYLITILSRVVLA